MATDQTEWLRNVASGRLLASLDARDQARRMAEDRASRGEDFDWVEAKAQYFDLEARNASDALNGLLTECELEERIEEYAAVQEIANDMGDHQVAIDLQCDIDLMQNVLAGMKEKAEADVVEF